MDADRRNNFINNKSVGAGVNSQQPMAIENGDGINNGHSAANGTISSSSTESSSDSSIEPPKQPFNDNNSNKDFYENNVCIEQFNSVEQRNHNDGIVEKRTDSVQQASNDRDSKDVLCSVLSDVVGGEKIIPDKMGRDGLRDVYINSMLPSQSLLLLSSSASPVNSSAQANNNHDKSDRSIDKQQNGDDNNYNSIDHQNEPCDASNGLINTDDSHHYDRVDKIHSHNDGVIVMTANNGNDKVNTNGINASTNNDIDVSINLNCLETVGNTVPYNQLVKNCEESNETVKETPTKLVVQNSSEDCISTDTISSNSIDVKPIKCPTDRSQTASESEEIVITSKPDETIKSEKRSTNMYDDNSLKMPLLGKQTNGNGNNDATTTVYSAIERPILSKRSKGNIDDNENCETHDVHNDDKKSMDYNEYVNLLCDTDRGGIFTKNTKRSASDESRPLLRQMSSDDGPASQKIQRRSNNTRPRSIVKSPSTQNFTSGSEKLIDINRKPRLSIQCTGNDPERPVLHVQFLSQKHNDSNDNIKKNLIHNVNSSASGEHESYQNGGLQCDSAEKPPEELINQMPTRGILRTSRLRSSISSSSTESTSSSSDSSSSDDISQFAEAKPPDGGTYLFNWHSI